MQHHTKLMGKVCCSGVLSAQFALRGYAPADGLRLIVEVMAVKAASIIAQNESNGYESSCDSGS